MCAENVCGASSCVKLSASFQKLKRKKASALPSMSLWSTGGKGHHLEGRCTILYIRADCVLGTISATQDKLHSDPEVTGKLQRRAGPAARHAKTVQRQSDIPNVLIIKVYCKLYILLLPFIQKKNHSKPTIKQGPGAGACRERPPLSWGLAGEQPGRGQQGHRVNTNYLCVPVLEHYFLMCR